MPHIGLRGRTSKAPSAQRYLRSHGSRSDLLTLISTATLLTVSAQTIGDTTIALVVVQANYAQQFPGGDLVDRFGTNSNIGLGAFRKFSNNYT